MQCESECSPDEPLPGAIQDAVAVAIEDGASMDEIVERVRSRGGDRSPLIPRARRCAPARPAEGRWAERMDGLICLQRETDRFAEEWVRTREPGAEGRSALIAIETLRTLALRTMADLSQRTEPVPAEDLARLALALHRIESADRLRIEREQTMADAAALAGPAARAATMTHAERVETVRRALEGHVFPGRTEPPTPASGWAAASPAASHVTPRRTQRPIRLPPPLPRIHVSLRRSRRPIRLPPAGRMMWGTPAGRRMYVTRAGRAIRGTRTGRGMPS